MSGLHGGDFLSTAPTAETAAMTQPYNIIKDGKLVQGNITNTPNYDAQFLAAVRVPPACTIPHSDSEIMPAAPGHQSRTVRGQRRTHPLHR